MLSSCDVSISRDCVGASSAAHEQARHDEPRQIARWLYEVSAKLEHDTLSRFTAGVTRIRIGCDGI